MRKVIEHGYKKYHTTCSVCSCFFEYELEDICIYTNNVECPDCKNLCTHIYALNVDITSQIKEENKNNA